jgi:hypothetical protein
MATAPAALLAQYTTPNVTTTAGDEANTLGSTVLINHGLVGVGRISASATDGLGESLGSISGMQITGWTPNGDGSFAGVMNILPDRGYNAGAFYSDYAARIQRISFTFRPYTGTTGIGGATDLDKLLAQRQIVFTLPVTTLPFTYLDPTTGVSATTGFDPGARRLVVVDRTAAERSRAARFARQCAKAARSELLSRGYEETMG